MKHQRMMVRNVSLPLSTHTALKTVAATEHRSASDIVRELIDEYVRGEIMIDESNAEKTQTAFHIMPDAYDAAMSKAKDVGVSFNKLVAQLVEYKARHA